MTDTSNPAGRRNMPRRWPIDPTQLLDTAICPACFAPLTSPVCSSCWLDLGVPRSTELLQRGRAIVDAEDARQSLISAMRAEQQQRQAAFAAQQAAAFAARQLVPVAAPQQAPASLPPQPARHSRSSVQILLLIVGVSLVSVAAIFFLTVAWVLTGLGVRSTIVAAATIAALGVAVLLRRRGLTATAEGIGALGVVLVLLDLWAVRGNDLLGAAGTAALPYWGIGLLVCVIIFFAVHAVSGLRATGVAAFVLTPLAVGLLAGALTESLGTAAQVTIAALAAAASTAIIPATRPTTSGWWPSHDRVPERLVLDIIAFVALATALAFGCFALPHADWVPLPGFALIAVLAAGLALLALRIRRPVALAGVFAVFGVFALDLIAPVVAARVHNATAFATICTLVAVVIALGCEPLLRRVLSPDGGAVIRSGMIAARVIAGGWLVVTVVVAATPFLQAIVSGATLTHTPFVTLQPAYAWAVATLVGVGALAAATWAWTGRLHARRVALAWFGAGVLILAVPFLVVLPIVLCTFVALAAAGYTFSIAATRHAPALRAFFWPALALMVVATTTAFIVGFASSATWWVGACGAVLVAYAARYIARGPSRSIARPILAAVAVVLTLVVAGVAPWTLTLSTATTGITTTENVLGGITLAVGLLAIINALPWRRFLRPLERRAVFWSLAPVGLLFLVPTATGPGQDGTASTGMLQPEPFAGVGRAALLVIAIGIWLFAPRNRAGFRWERRAAAAALTPGLALLANACARSADASTRTLVIVVAASALIGAALALVVAVVDGQRDRRQASGQLVRGARAPWHRLRTPMDVGAAAVMAAALLFGATGPVDVMWFVLLLTGVGLLLAALTPDGLFGAAGPRRQLGWAALALGIAALWMRLSAGHVDVVEAYVLPPAVALLLLAWLLHRYGTERRAGAAPIGVAALVFAGLLVAAVPLSFAAAGGTLLRPIVVGACGSALLLVAAAKPLTPTGPWYRAAVGVPGALTVLMVGAGRAAAVDIAARPMPFTFDIWLGCAAIVLCAAGILVALGAGREAPVLVGVGLGIWLLPVALVASDGPVLRPVLVLAIGAATALCAAASAARPRWRTTSWVAMIIGVLAICITAGGRILSLFGADGPVDGRLEAWLLPALATLAVTAVLLDPSSRLAADTVAQEPSMAPGSRGGHAATGVAQALLIGAVSAALLIGVAALGFAPLALTRVLLMAWGFSAVHALAFWFDRRPLTHAVGWLAIAAAIVAAAIGAPLMSPTPFELATVPIAAALVVSGGLHLMRTPTARSWPWIGPGVAALLLPSLIIGFWDAPLWRIVALGVAAIGAILIGLVMRLQAPFLIGCAVAVTHALVQLWPWIAVAYQATQWWLWVGIGGLLLIAIAARYERRIRDVKAAVVRISALR